MTRPDQLRLTHIQPPPMAVSTVLSLRNYVSSAANVIASVS
jgi:hypothetical protein